MKLGSFVDALNAITPEMREFDLERERTKRENARVAEEERQREWERKFLQQPDKADEIIERLDLLVELEMLRLGGTEERDAKAVEQPLEEQARIPAEAAAPVSGDGGTAPPDYEKHSFEAQTER